MKSRIKKIILLIFITIISAFLSLEIILRIFTKPSLTPGLLVTHPERRYEFKPNVNGKSYNADVKINSSGLRDRDRKIKKALGIYRIGIFGDSISFGYGVQQTNIMSMVLEKKLNQKYKTIEVFNFSIPSYNTVHEYLYLKDVYKVYNFDMVIFIFYAGNDTKLSDPPGGVKGINKYFIFRKIKDIFRNTYSYRWLNVKYYTIIYYLFHRIKFNNDIDADTDYIMRLYSDDFKGWQECKNAFFKISNICSDNNITSIFAIFANNYKLANKLENDIMYPIIQKVRNALQLAEIKYIVVLDNAFRKYHQNESVLWIKPDDTHFSPLAHYLAANHIYNYIIRNKIIKKD